MSEQEIEEYICLHKDETLRTLQAAIKENFGVSKSLKWISKARKEYQEEPSADEPVVEVEPATEESDPEILRLQKDIRKEQLKEDLELAKARVGTIQELVEKTKKQETTISLLKRRLEDALKNNLDNWVNALCPDCGGKFLLQITETFNPNYAICVLCKKTWRLSP